MTSDAQRGNPLLAALKNVTCSELVDAIGRGWVPDSFLGVVFMAGTAS
jgi:hypothetical protein